VDDIEEGTAGFTVEVVLWTDDVVTGLTTDVVT
jgi:hypothetical protein